MHFRNSIDESLQQKYKATFDWVSVGRKYLWLNKHLMTGPKENTKFCLAESLNASRSEACNLFFFFILTEIFNLKQIFTLHSRSVEKMSNVMVSFPLSSKRFVASSKTNVNIFRTECLPRHQSAMLFCKSFASSFQTFPCLVKLFVVGSVHGTFAFFKTFLA